MLVEHVDAISVDAGMDTRKPRVLALKKLNFHDADVRKIQSACVNAHEALLAAEAGQAEARALFASLITNVKFNNHMDHVESQRVQGVIQAAQNKTEEAKKLFPACDAPIEQLRRKIH